MCVQCLCGACVYSICLCGLCVYSVRLYGACVYSVCLCGLCVNSECMLVWSMCVQCVRRCINPMCEQVASRGQVSHLTCSFSGRGLLQPGAHQYGLAS